MRFILLLLDAQKWRVVFFLGMAFMGLAPLAHLWYDYGFMSMIRFVSECNILFVLMAAALKSLSSSDNSFLRIIHHRPRLLRLAYSRALLCSETSTIHV